MATIIFGPFQPFLEDQFFEQVSRLKENDPNNQFTPITIITPTGTLLKRLTTGLTKPLAEGRKKAWLNLHFFTFYTYSENILRTLGIDFSRPTLVAASRLFLKELLTEEVKNDPNIEHFLKYDSYVDRILNLFSQLTSYKVSEKTAASVIENKIEKSFFNLFLRYNVLKGKTETENRRAASIYNREDIIGLASQTIRENDIPPFSKNVLLYGFYDLNPLQREIVKTLNEKGDLTIFCPLTGEEPFSGYAKPTIDFFRSLADGASKEIVYQTKDGQSPHLTISDSLFLAGSAPKVDFANSPEDLPKDLITVVTSSGAMGEARAVALEILRTKEEHPDQKWREIGVTMRDLPTQRDNLYTVFEKYSIPVYFERGRPLKSYIEVRTFLNLLSVLTTKLKRRDISTLLFSDYFSWPEVTEKQKSWVRDNSHLVEIIARDAGIVSGTKVWVDAWKESNSELFIDENIYIEVDKKVDNEERLTDIERFKSLTEKTILALIDDITNIADSSTPDDYSRIITNLLTKYILQKDNPEVDAPSPYEALKKIVTSMADLRDTTPAQITSNKTISLKDFIALLNQEITESTVATNADTDAVFVTSIMGIRGLAFKTLILMGLNEKKFPKIPRTDPLISESSRGKLGLPTAKGRFEEEKLQFALTVRAAGERLVLSYQRSDDTGRKSIYSIFLREILLRAGASEEVLNDGFSHGDKLPAVSTIHYPRLFFTGQEYSKYTEKDIRISSTLLGNSIPIDNVRGVVSQSTFLRDGLVSRNARNINNHFSTYDGVIGKTDDILEKLLPLSPGKLEVYAGCPFRFFMKYVIGADVKDEPTEDEDIDAMEIGSLYHNVLAKLFKTLKEKKLFPLTEENVAIATGLLKTIITESINSGLSGRIPKLVVRARREVMEEKLHELIFREMENDGSQFIPTLFEAPFGPFGYKTRDRTEPSPPLIINLNNREIPFVGRIDRIDVNEEDEVFRVIDYKKRRASSHKNISTQIEEGSHFQIPIYLLAAKEVIFSNKFRPDLGRLIFIEYPKDKGEDTLEGDIESALSTMKEWVSKYVDSIERGVFPPEVSDFCKFCSYGNLCRYETKGINKIRRERSESQSKK